MYVEYRLILFFTRNIIKNIMTEIFIIIFIFLKDKFFAKIIFLFFRIDRIRIQYHKQL
jgi:hypothetical protein